MTVSHLSEHLSGMSPVFTFIRVIQTSGVAFLALDCPDKPGNDGFTFETGYRSQDFNLVRHCPVSCLFLRHS